MEQQANPNDVDVRETIRWKRYSGDDWDCFDALPPAVRHRMHEHAYDAWSVNAHKKWRQLLIKRASSKRATHSMMRFLDECESLEQEAFAKDHQRKYGTPLAHREAKASILRYDSKKA